MQPKHLGGDREVAGELTEPGGEIQGLVPGVGPVEVLRIVLPHPGSQPVERSAAAEGPGPGVERGGEGPPGRQRAGEGGGGGGQRGGIGHG
jgi:hypothetical protein